MIGGNNPDDQNPPPVAPSYSGQNAAEEDYATPAEAKGLGAQIWEKTKLGASLVGAKAKEIDERHSVVEKTKSVGRSIGEKTQEINQKHQITEKASRGLAQGASWVSKSIQNIRDSGKGGGQGGTGDAGAAGGQY